MPHTICNGLSLCLQLKKALGVKLQWRYFGEEKKVLLVMVEKPRKRWGSTAEGTSQLAKAVIEKLGKAIDNLS